MKAKIKKWLRNPKVIVVLSVFVLTMATIGVSYSAFLSVKTSTGNQTITTGTLNVTYTNTSENPQDEAIQKTNMQRMDDDEGLKQSDARYIFIQNSGTLPANYFLTVGYDMANYNKLENKKEGAELTPLEYIKIAVFEQTTSEDGEKVNNLIAGPVTLADLTVYSADETDDKNNKYLLLFDSINAVEDATKTYVVKTWLSAEATSSVSKSYFYVTSDIIAEAAETRVTYNFTGKLQNSDGTAIKDATISIQNNSKIVKTDDAGNFNIEGLLPAMVQDNVTYAGAYNLDIITSDNKVYSTTFTLNKGETQSITERQETQTNSQANMKISTAAYIYGTTINKIKELNNINELSTNYPLINQYKVPKTYIITGTDTEDLGTLTITLGEDDITSIALS